VEVACLSLQASLDFSNRDPSIGKTDRTWREA
jgi:hypothetical protein